MLLALDRPASCRSVVRSRQARGRAAGRGERRRSSGRRDSRACRARERARTADGQGRAVAAHDVEVREVQGAGDRREQHPGDAHAVARRADDRHASGHRVQRAGRRGVEDHARAGDDDARRARVAGHDVVVERRDEDGARAGARDLQPVAARRDGVVVDGQRGRSRRCRGDDDAIQPRNPTRCSR